MQFNIKAAHRNAGADVQLTIDAASKDGAMQQANEMGLLVASISESPSSPPSASRINTSTGQIFCRSCGKGLLEQAIACTSCGKAPLAGQSFCWKCGSATQEGAVVCVRCGVALSSAKQGTKSKIVAGILGILLGGWGVHNFYLGYIGKGIGQLVLWLTGLLLVFFGIGFLMMIGAWIWGVVEGVMILTGSIKTDGAGNPLKD